MCEQASPKPAVQLQCAQMMVPFCSVTTQAFSGAMDDLCKCFTLAVMRNEFCLVVIGSTMILLTQPSTNCLYPSRLISLQLLHSIRAGCIYKVIEDVGILHLGPFIPFQPVLFLLHRHIWVLDPSQSRQLLRIPGFCWLAKLKIIIQITDGFTCRGRTALYMVYGGFSQTTWVRVPQLPVFYFSPFSFLLSHSAG